MPSCADAAPRRRCASGCPIPGSGEGCRNRFAAYPTAHALPVTDSKQPLVARLCVPAHSRRSLAPTVLAHFSSAAACASMRHHRSWMLITFCTRCLGECAGLVHDERIDFSINSRASASLINTFLRPRPTPTMMEIGVARPRAHGQAMMRTETAITRAFASVGGGPANAHTTKRSRHRDHSRNEPAGHLIAEELGRERLASLPCGRSGIARFPRQLSQPESGTSQSG